jgi:hypothetical protein
MRTLALFTLATLGCNASAPPAAVMPVHQAATVQEAIEYHGGSLITWDPAVYLIYYGGWSTSAAPPVIEHFVSHVGGSAWFAINAQYTDGSGAHPPGALHLAGTTVDDYSRGTDLADGDVRYIVENAIYQGKLTDDPSGIYVVLPSADVAEGNFCKTNCGFHTYTQWGQDWYTYIFVGNPGHCPNVCPEYTPSPNGVPDADEMVDILGHELSETVTDPYVDAWYDASGQENADKCAWTFGTMFQTTSGAYANLTLDGKPYLVQRNWVPGSPGRCDLAP